MLDAQEGTVPGEQNYNNVLRFDEASEEVVFEFDLPQDSAGGQIRLFGSNLDALNVGIWNPADGGSWYQTMGEGYGRGSVSMGNWCCELIALNAILNMCCCRPF